MKRVFRLDSEPFAIIADEIYVSSCGSQGQGETP